MPPALAGVANPLPQDDAGSGGDAGDGPATAVPAAPGVVLEGTLASPDPRDPPLFMAVDGDHDWYWFDAPAGARLDLRADGLRVCIDLGSGADGRCATPYGEARIQATLPAQGRYHVHVDALGTAAPQPYRFSYALDAAAPDPVLARRPEPPQDDAGSGRDAGDAADGAVPILPGVGYQARAVSPGDADWFSF